MILIGVGSGCSSTVPHSLLLGPGLLLLLDASRHICGNIARRGGTSSGHAPHTWKNQKPKTYRIYLRFRNGAGPWRLLPEWMEVRGQLLTAGSSLPPHGYRGLNSRWRRTALVIGAYTYWAILQAPLLLKLLDRHSPTAPWVQSDQPMLQVRIRSFSMSCWQSRCLQLDPMFSDRLCSG